MLYHAPRTGCSIGTTIVPETFLSHDAHFDLCCVLPSYEDALDGGKSLGFTTYLGAKSRMGEDNDLFCVINEKVTFRLPKPCWYLQLIQMCMGNLTIPQIPACIFVYHILGSESFKSGSSTNAHNY